MTTNNERLSQEIDATLICESCMGAGEINHSPCENCKQLGVIQGKYSLAMIQQHLLKLVDKVDWDLLLNCFQQGKFTTVQEAQANRLRDSIRRNLALLPEDIAKLIKSKFPDMILK